MNIFFSGFVLLLFAGKASANFKKWIPNTNFENANNWNVGRVPCGNDKVHFPESSPPIFIQTNTSVMEMVLPRDGELILGSYISLGFQNTPDSSCSGTDVQFTSTDPKSWFDPDNWCVTHSFEGECTAAQPRVLDTERLPCKYDGVEFPRDHSFYVNLDTAVDIFTGSLRLGRKSYSTGDFRAFLNTEEGKKQFVREVGPSPTTVNILGETCDDVTGCSCGNDHGALLEKVCDIVESRCPGAECFEPLRPIGGCCDVCGSLLFLDYTKGFKVTTLKNLIQNGYVQKNPGYHTVEAIISKTSTDQIQVVLTDGATGGAAVEVGRLLAKDLQADIDGRNKYGLIGVRIQTSGSLEPTSSAQTGSKMSSQSIIGLVIAIIVLLAVIALVMFCFMDRRSSHYRNKLVALKESLRRITAKEEEGDLELAPTIAYKDSLVLSDIGFDNPMYNRPITNGLQGEPADQIATVSGATFMPQFADPSETNVGFSNPLYNQGSIEEIGYINGMGQMSMLTLNPMYSPEEADSSI